jgi:hypothetical protein
MKDIYRLIMQYKESEGSQVHFDTFHCDIKVIFCIVTKDKSQILKSKCFRRIISLTSKPNKSVWCGGICTFLIGQFSQSLIKHFYIGQNSIWYRPFQ